MILLLGDCLHILPELPAESVDSIVTDPPYGLSFMGKKWDYDVPFVDIWKECLRVLKPGGHLLAFGGTRTYHRLVVAIEDAGFEIRDQIQWIYGQGFPKSQDISKAIDKAAGRIMTIDKGGKSNPDYKPRAPTTPEAKQWPGWGTALKPANEPICLARKPLSESTIAKNVLKHGTGGLNIDGTRIETSETLGRFPSNVIFDEDAAKVLDEQTGVTGSGSGAVKVSSGKKSGAGTWTSKGGMQQPGKENTGVRDFGDSGGASRFFYIAKASKSERGKGNTHPTVKPIKLMEYLIRLITPPGGTVLDPFAGSGTTGIAAANLGFDFIGIEMNSEYYQIAEKRLCR